MKIKRTKLDTNAGGDDLAIFSEKEFREEWNVSECESTSDAVDEANSDPAWKFEIVSE